MRPDQWRLADPALDVVEVVLQLAGSSQSTERCPQPQRAVCRDVLLNREDEVEDLTSGRIGHGCEPFAEPSWPGEQINYRNCAHVLKFLRTIPGASSAPHHPGNRH